jgi:hypothetical protein
VVERGHVMLPFLFLRRREHSRFVPGSVLAVEASGLSD